MKYTEKVGEIETIFEGTADEIVELQDKMKPKTQNTDSNASNAVAN